MKILNNGVMSNAFSFATPLLTPRGSKTTKPRETIAYTSAMRCREVFEEARPGLPFHYEIATGYSEDPDWQELFCETVDALDIEGITAVSLFLLPGPPGHSIQTQSHFDSVVEYLSKASDLVNGTSIEHVSILPYGWKDDINDPPFRAKRRREVVENVAAVINMVCDNVSPSFEFLFESLSGRDRPGEPSLELPMFNQPHELLDLLHALDSSVPAGLVVDWAHLFYGAQAEREARKRIEKLVELISEGLVKQMHLSISKTRGRSRPSGKKVDQKWVGFTKQRVEWIAQGLREIVDAGYEVPPTVAEIFVPADLKGLLDLPETGVRRARLPEQFVELFEAVDADE